MWFNTGEKEVALIIAEDNPHCRHLMRHGLNFLKSGYATELPAVMQEWLPITRVVDTVHLLRALNQIPLQFADIVAFIVKRHLEGAKDNDRFFKASLGNATVDFGANESFAWRCARERVK
jgi:hypothetical protein